MSRNASLLLSLVLTVVFVGSTCSAERSDDKEQKSSSQTHAGSLNQPDRVKEALHREIYGLTSERNQFLATALESNPNNKPARWHSGFVQQDGDWIRFNDFPERSHTAATIVAYRQMRDRSENTSQSQLELANWCAENNLADRERAHLHAVLDVNSNHVEARERLGFQLDNGRWVSQAETEAAENRVEQIRRSIEQWGDKMRLALKTLDDRDAALTILDACDASSIPAMEVLVASQSRPAAELVMESLSKRNYRSATSALARQSIISSWPKVRNSAARSLRNRDLHDFVPYFLSNLYTPLEAKKEAVYYRDGELVYSRTFTREAEQESNLVFVETAYRRVAREGGLRADTYDRAFDEIREARDNHAQWLEKENQRRTEFNERVISALANAVGQQLSSEPQGWWQWWNDHNEIYMKGQKPEQPVFQSNSLAIIDRLPPPPPPPSQRDCLAAGTAIWTEMGAVAVEDLQVGDLVLAQDIETGELAYKAVTRTTIRPKTRLVRIQTEREQIDASGGHAFWVSGEGWVKARELTSGMELHTVDGSSTISNVETLEGIAETYNLHVSDTHNYFVGESLILSHDNSIRQPTDAIVPGLLEE